MRNYGSPHVRNRVVRGRANAVCAFPGKHPLRLTWCVSSKALPALTASYYGKFTTAAWKRLVAVTHEVCGQDYMAASRFTLFDRNGEIASGSPFDVRNINTIHQMRYFPYEGVRLRDFLATVEIRACGPYWVYATEPIADREKAHVIRNIETQIPTLRNR